MPIPTRARETLRPGRGSAAGAGSDATGTSMTTGRRIGSDWVRGVSVCTARGSP